MIRRSQAQTILEYVLISAVIITAVLLGSQAVRDSVKNLLLETATKNVTESSLARYTKEIKANY